MRLEPRLVERGRDGRRERLVLEIGQRSARARGRAPRAAQRGRPLGVALARAVAGPPRRAARTGAGRAARRRSTARSRAAASRAAPARRRGRARAACAAARRARGARSARRPAGDSPQSASIRRSLETTSPRVQQQHRQQRLLLGARRAAAARRPAEPRGAPESRTRAARSGTDPNRAGSCVRPPYHRAVSRMSAVRKRDAGGSETADPQGEHMRLPARTLAGTAAATSALAAFAAVPAVAGGGGKPTVEREVIQQTFFDEFILDIRGVDDEHHPDAAHDDQDVPRRLRDGSRQRRVHLRRSEHRTRAVRPHRQDRARRNAHDRRARHPSIRERAKGRSSAMPGGSASSRTGSWSVAPTPSCSRPIPPTCTADREDRRRPHLDGPGRTCLALARRLRVVVTRRVTIRQGDDRRRRAERRADALARQRRVWGGVALRSGARWSPYLNRPGAALMPHASASWVTVASVMRSSASRGWAMTCSRLPTAVAGEPASSHAVATPRGGPPRARSARWRPEAGQS